MNLVRGPFGPIAEIRTGCGIGGPASRSHASVCIGIAVMWLAATDPLDSAAQEPLRFGERSHHSAPALVPPVASLRVTPSAGFEPLLISADASGSNDPHGAVISYRFDFGDGTIVGPQANPVVSHTYAAGLWSARVTVINAEGLADTATFQVAVSNSSGNVPPAASLELIPNSGSYGAGAIRLASDPNTIFPHFTLPRPGYLAPISDPTFGTRVTRITEVAPGAFSAIGGAGKWGADARHHYMSDQPWNADGTLIAIENGDTPRQIFLDGETYEVALLECGNYSRRDDRWHPTLPHVRINVKEDKLSWFDIINCTELRSWQLPFPVQGIGDGAGNPSRDGRYIALADSSKMFVVDMDPQPPYAPYPNVRIGPVYDFSSCPLSKCKLGWVSVSPSGKYVLMKYSGDHPQVFNLSTTTLALTPRPMPASSPRCSGTAALGFIYDIGHGDLALNPFDADEDVMVGQEHCDRIGRVVSGQLLGGVVMVRLRDGAITALTDPTDEAYPHHISTRNVDRPGWAYAGFYRDPGERFSGELVAIKMDGSKAVERLAHLHTDTSGDCYRCEAHAVPSPDGRRAIWASNWNLDCAGCGPASEIKAYVVDTRPPLAAPAPHDEPLIVTADASASHDIDGSIVSYTFDFDDGTLIGPQLSPRATHTLLAGTRNVMVTVVDNRGVSRTTVRSMTVNGTDQPPIVTAPPSASGNPGAQLTIYVTAWDPNADPITSLTANLSGLPAGHGAVFNRSADNRSGTLTWSPSQAHLGGPYAVTFTASNAMSGSTTTSITVTRSNQPPTANLVVTPVIGIDPQPVTADASGSSDPDGSIATYTFDFGDGTVVGPQASPNATHVLGAGSWTVAVTVADDQSALDVSSEPVTVHPNLVLNPSFEGSFSGWKENGGSTMAVVPNGYHGSDVLEMVGPATTESFGVNDSPNWIDPVASAGAVYRFSTWVRSATSSSNALIKIREYLDGIQQGGTFRSERVAISPLWQQISTDYVTLVSGSTLDLTVAIEPTSPGEVFQADLVQAALISGGSEVAGHADAAGDRRDRAVAVKAEPLKAWIEPNPVGQIGSLHLTTSRTGKVDVRLFDVHGRQLITLANGLTIGAGRHSFSFATRSRNGTPLQPGVYFYRVVTGEGVRSGRFLVLW